MRIAVVGGGLLGCASVVNLSLVQEIDASSAGDGEPDKHTISLLCREDHPGGSDFHAVDVDIDDQERTSVEVGLYRILPEIKGSYLADLLDLANGQAGCVSFFGRRIPIPGHSRVARGKPNAAPRISTWANGSYGRLIRSSVVWNFEDDTYSQIHKGWSILDLLRRVFNNEIWRAAAVAAFCWSVRRVIALEGMLSRGQGLVLCVVLLAPVILSPAGLIEIWQRTYSFWGSTIPALLNYGLTAGIARGSTEGFCKAMAENNLKNRATCARSVGELISRTGLEPYLRGSGRDYTSKFKYDADYVKRYIAPFVDDAYPTNEVGFESINSLACHFALYDGDYSNSDAHTRIVQVRPNNVALCQGLIDAARTTTPVDVKYNCTVQVIDYDESKDEYTITTKNGRKFCVDSVILAECPENSQALSLGGDGDDIEDLLGYENVSDGADSHSSSASSHIAVIQGVASASFFRYATEKQIPDVISVTDSVQFSRFERITEVSPKSGTAVYVLYCCSEFEGSDIMKNMFENSENAKVLYFGRRDSATCGNLYKAGMVEKKNSLDTALPQLVWGNRFIYAAACKAVARHPEMDAMAALNAASLLSKAVKWQLAKNDENQEVEEEEEDDDENEISEDINDGVDEPVHC